MSTPTNHGATDIKGAAGRIAALFTPELERPTGEGETPSQDVQEAVQEPVAQEPEEAADVVQEGSETLESDTEEFSRRIKAKLGDREVELELLTDDIDPDLIPKGLMMEADYRKKTMELAENRKAIEAKQEQIDAKFNEAAELIQFEVDDLESPEMQELKEYDPDSYWKKFDQVKKKADKLTAWRQEQQDKLGAQNEAHIKVESEKLVQAVPDWLDADKKATDLKDLGPYLTQLGFNEQELAALGAPHDHRLLAMARKAMMFDRVSSQDIEAKRVKPKSKTVEPTGGAKPNIEADKMKAKRNQLKKSGNVRDAQAVFSELFKFK